MKTHPNDSEVAGAVAGNGPSRETMPQPRSQANGASRPPANGAAARNRRYRERRRCGLRVWPVELDEATIGRLIERGYVSLDDASSPDRMAQALGELIERVAETGRVSA